MAYGAINYAGPSPVGGNPGNSMATLAMRLFGQQGGQQAPMSPEAAQGMAQLFGMPGAPQGGGEPGTAPGQQWLDRINARPDNAAKQAAMQRYQQWAQQRGGGMPQQQAMPQAMPMGGGWNNAPMRVGGGGMPGGAPAFSMGGGGVGAGVQFGSGMSNQMMGWQPQGLGLGGGMNPGAFGANMGGASSMLPAPVSATPIQQPPPAAAPAPAQPSPPPMSNLPMPAQPKPGSGAPGRVGTPAFQNKVDFQAFQQMLEGASPVQANMLRRRYGMQGQ